MTDLKLWICDHLCLSWLNKETFPVFFNWRPYLSSILFSSAIAVGNTWPSMDCLSDYEVLYFITSGNNSEQTERKPTYSSPQTCSHFSSLLCYRKYVVYKSSIKHAVGWNYSSVVQLVRCLWCFNNLTAPHHLDQWHIYVLLSKLLHEKSVRIFTGND